MEQITTFSAPHIHTSNCKKFKNEIMKRIGAPFTQLKLYSFGTSKNESFIQASVSCAKLFLCFQINQRRQDGMISPPYKSCFEGACTSSLEIKSFQTPAPSLISS
ncbi:hypothetical protein Dimus_014407 [Dionaea muscipula]